MPAAVRFEIFPADLEVTARFYTEVLGFSIHRDERSSEVAYMAMDRDGIELGASASPMTSSCTSRRPPIGVELVLEVDDLMAERDHVARAGWPVIEELTDRPWGYAIFASSTPTATTWRITSP